MWLTHFLPHTPVQNTLPAIPSTNQKEEKTRFSLKESRCQTHCIDRKIATASASKWKEFYNLATPRLTVKENQLLIQWSPLRRRNRRHQLQSVTKRQICLNWMQNKGKVLCRLESSHFGHLLNIANWHRVTHAQKFSIFKYNNQDLPKSRLSLFR